MIIRIFIILFLCLAPRAYAATDVFDAKVLSVYDGDTFWFKAAGRKKAKCRTLRYNAPELRGAEKPEGLKARDYLRALINGKDIKIQTKGKDRYKRWLCEFWHGGQNINNVMIEYLKDYPGRDKYKHLNKK